MEQINKIITFDVTQTSIIEYMTTITRERHIIKELTKSNQRLRREIEGGQIDPLFSEQGFLAELIRISKLKSKRFGDPVGHQR